MVSKSEYNKAYYLANPEKYKLTQEQRDRKNARRRELYAKDEKYKENIKAQVKESVKRNPLRKKTARLRSYGLTPECYINLLKSQNFCCAICGYWDMSDKNVFPLVDHCHLTGKVRGLLCMACNQMLGKAKDQPETLLNAARYLMSAG